MRTTHTKFFKVVILAAVFSFIVLASHTALARQLENDYPQIPLPGFGNFSLNQIFLAVTGDEAANTAAGNLDAYNAFKAKDPLSTLILYFYVLAVMVVGLVAFGALIIAGVKFLLSAANPGLRREAKEHLVAAIIGLVILLGSWIILNTINPELRILHKVGESTSTLILAIDIDPGKATEVLPGQIFTDSKTLRYGGIVLYRDIDPFPADPPDGRSSRSETVFNDVENFAEGAWVANQLSGVRILGECNITLFDDAGFGPPSWFLIGPGSFTPPSFPDNAPSSIRIDKGNCLGNSVTAYEDEEYQDRTLPIIHDIRDLSTDMFRAGGLSKDANDDIDSIKFASTTEYDAITGATNLTIAVCRDAEWQNCAGGITKNIPKMSDDEQLNSDDKWSDSVSSLVLGGTGTSRQAGVILYNKEELKGTSEVFITSDSRLGNPTGQTGKTNIVKANTTGEGEWVSSLQIIGEYTVTLYSEDLFAGNYLRFYNNASTTGYAYGVAGIAGPDLVTSTERTNGILAIPRLSDYPYPNNFPDPDPTTTWNDNKVKSIQLWIPKEIYDNQNLGPPGSCPGAILCVL